MTAITGLPSRWAERLAEHGPRRIGFTDATDERILVAARDLADEGVVAPVLIGEPTGIAGAAAAIDIDLEGIEVLDVASVADDAEMQRTLTIAWHGRRHPPIPELIRQPLHAGTLLLAERRIDGCVAGASRTSGDVIRAGIRTVGLARGSSAVNSCFLLVLPDGRPVAYGDCAVIPEPTAEELAQIAIATSGTYRLLTEDEPVVALLSYSTKGSADTTASQRVRQAVDEVRRLDPDLAIDGELQFDAAVSARVAKVKAPDSPIGGRANVFVFPNLDAGNIGYKLTQYFANASAYGPLLQGMARPLNDLSRGCVPADVVAVAKITALQSLGRRLSG